MVILSFKGRWLVGRRRASAGQGRMGALGARARHGLFGEERETVDELSGTRSGEADDGLGGLQVGRFAAAVAAHGEVQALLEVRDDGGAVSYTHLRAHETRHDLVCRLLLE